MAALQIAGSQSLRLNLRELTRAAGVTPALLHYYFRDLDGLVASLLNERGAPLLEPLREELLTRPVSAAATLSRFLHKWSSLLARHPWMLPCLLQAAPDDAAPAESLAAALRDTVTQAQRDGAVRTDMSGHYIAMLLLMLGALPHFSGTLLGEGLDVSAEPAAAAQVTLQHLSLLQRGITA